MEPDATVYKAMSSKDTVEALAKLTTRIDSYRAALLTLETSDSVYLAVMSTKVKTED
jgi:hypothetical protein